MEAKFCGTLIILGAIIKMLRALSEFDFLPDIRFDNYPLDHGLLWESPCSTTLMCAVRCISSKACISFYYNQEKKRCRGYETLMLTTEAGGYENSWSYFYFTDIGKWSFKETI
jgi:hypothetical protein